MQGLSNALQGLLNLLIQISNLVVDAIVVCEIWLRGQLSVLGVPHTLQSIILITVAVVLVLGAFQLFGRLIRVAVVIILLLVAIHALIPAIQ